jgi:lysophospholipase L1-like esterase
VAPPGTYRIVALGDSVTYGRGVVPQKTFATVLSDLLDTSNPDRDHEVLNLGVGGYNTIQEAEQYRVRGRKYSPDVVLLAYVLNDPIPASASFNAISGLGTAAKEVGGVEWTSWAASWSHLARFIGSRMHELQDPESREAPPYPPAIHHQPATWNVVTRGMADLAAQTQPDGTPVVVIVPTWVSFDSYRFMHVQVQVADEARKHGFAVLDPLGAGAFADSDGRALQLTPGDELHPNAEGHRRLAVSIERFLREKDYFPQPGSRGPSSRAR